MRHRKYSTGVSVVSGIMWLLSRFPLSFHYFWGRRVSWVMKNLLGYRREVVMTNIVRSFPEKNYAELKQISDRFYQHLGEIMAEAVWFGGSGYGRLARAGLCRATNPEVLVDAYADSPSVTVLFSHCGNWEIMGGICSYLQESYSDALPFTEDNIFVVYKKQRSAFWDALVRKNRLAPVPDSCRGVMESSDILRFCIRNRDRKNIYVYPTDQYPYSGAHDIGMFMNQPTRAMFGGAGVAHKLGMSVLYLKMANTGRGHYEMTFIPICKDASSMEVGDIVRRYYDLLEEEIRETPHNWLWSHRRWK